MATSRIPAAIDAIVAAFTAADITTWDGPVVVGEEGDCVFVGYDADPEGDFLHVEADQEWAGIGARSRDEEFDVICAARVRRGDADVRAIRVAAYNLLADVENALRANPSLSQAPPFVAEFRPGQTFITWDANAGLEARAVFMVHVKTRV